MDDSNSSLCSGSSNEENNAPDNKAANKICGVCSDKAKSYHFGGLCCESCKAFFRRAMLNDSFKSFFCVHGQTCTITKENRRSCQYCRIQKCFSIGMEKGKQIYLQHAFFVYIYTKLCFTFQDGSAPMKKMSG